MKTKNLENKLKAYSTLAAGVFAVSANAQTIVYTDVNPDVVLSQDSFLLDLNNDGTNDFKILQCRTASAGSYLFNYQIGIIDNYSSNQILQNSIWLIPAKNFNDTIDAKQTIWNSTSASLFAEGTISGSFFGSGYWEGATDKYASLRFIINGKWHYGWVRLDVSGDASTVTVKDYAYDTIPYQGILAGDNGTSIKENTLLKNVSVYFNNKTLFVDFKDNNITDGVIKLYNTAGQEIKAIVIDNTKMEINTSDVPYGIYFIKVFVDDKLFVKKLIVQ